MGIYGKVIDLQKLGAAWDHVRKNKPASGVDNVTYEDFESRRREELKQLNLDLVMHQYESLPVKIMSLYKGEKVRTIALFSMRDKVVQQSLASELGKIYEPAFSDCSYAYRRGQSALQAIECIENRIRQGDSLWVLKMDIVNFFDNISHEKLLRKLRGKIKEEDVLDLINSILKTAVLDEKTGDLTSNRRGIFQGSSCAPILSNIYLMDFDREMERRCGFYIRYSDDILVLETEEKKAEEIYGYASRLLADCDLAIKEAKTQLHRVTETEGFEYLGYAFNSRGKMIPEKATASLTARLETMWLTSGLEMEEKFKKGREIIGGWEQYYREERKISSILEYVLVLSMVQNKEPELLGEFEKQRFQYENFYKDVTGYMAEYWKNKNNMENVILEYEQFYQVPNSEKEKKQGAAETEELISCYDQLLIRPDEELYLNLIQLYTDMGCYKAASHFWERKAAFDREHSYPESLAATTDIALNAETVPMDIDYMEYSGLFVGRDDIYVSETLAEGNRRNSREMLEPLTEEKIRKHLAGNLILGTYVLRPNSTAKYLVFDVDVSKKVLLRHAYGTQEFHRYKQKAAEYVLHLCRVLRQMGMTGYMEDSGFRGYHVWIFFTEWIPVRYVNQLSDCIQKKVPCETDDVTVEVFPNSSRVRPGKNGQNIKLPLGVHIRTGERSYFLDNQFLPVQDYREFLSGIARISLQAVRKILGTCMPESVGRKEQKTVDENLECFGMISDSVRIVLERCSLMRYLCQKAVKTGYLTHFERMSVLYVFGHMGEDGKEFVHTVMAFTLNYKYNVTQKFIIKLREKPVSCAKLREQYKLMTAEYGCSCSFRQTKNCYPSPVLHALKNSGDDQTGITLPISRTFTKAKEEKVYEEINIHKQVQKLAQQIVELKKQKHGLDKSIRKIEMDLQRTFDQAGIDCLEIEMGILVRRKKETGYEWLIEI